MIAILLWVITAIREAFEIALDAAHVFVLVFKIVWGPVYSLARKISPQDFGHVIVVFCLTFASVLSFASTVFGDISHGFAFAAAGIVATVKALQAWFSPPTFGSDK